MLITPGIFPYIYHVGSNFNIPSILSNGLIPGGQELNGRQSVFFLLIDPRDENHQDPENVDYSVPRRARYVQNSWKRHQDTVFWIDIDHGIIKEGLRFYQTKSNAIILQGVLPPSCIVKAERLKGGEPLYKRQYLSPRPPPKISLRNDLDWAKGTMIWALQLNINQLGNSFNSHLEKQFTLTLPSQSNLPKLIEIARGNP